MSDDFYNKTLSKNLRAIRRAKGLTTIDLAKILGVSQAKISYIEHCKGILSARDIAVLARRLEIPVTDFFQGLDREANPSERDEIASHLIHYGATLLAKPSSLTLKPPPFELAICQAIGYIDDDRLHKAFCAALIIHAAKKQIHFDRIFALIGNNPFLLQRIAEEAQACLQIISVLNHDKKLVGSRAERQIQHLHSYARTLSGKELDKPLTPGEIGELAGFVGGSLHAKR